MSTIKKPYSGYVASALSSLGMASQEVLREAQRLLERPDSEALREAQDQLRYLEKITQAIHILN